MIETNRLVIGGIPAVIWGSESPQVYVFVHGKMSSKEEASQLAALASAQGWQTLSFDLPEHGERTGGGDAFNAWNGVRDLHVIGAFVKSRWARRSLFACSFGCYLSLLAYADLGLEKARFLSPILDLERLITNMMSWFGVSEAELAQRKEVPTPIGEVLSWEYLEWVREHPVQSWPVPTSIFYGSKDALTEREVVDRFSQRYGAELTVCEDAEHFVQGTEHLERLAQWLAARI